jgi:BolA family transcriptional regulator, general stress-responsive regulator
MLSVYELLDFWKPMNSQSYQDRIRQKLTAAFAPIHLEILDDSARHKGHAGHDPKGETHFKIRIVSTVFAGLSRVDRHRLVYESLATELKERVHALNIEALAADEYNHK